MVASLLSTALNTALPQMMVDFGVNASTGQWLSSIYSLVMGIMVLATPFLIRRFPTRRLFLTMIAIFGAGVLCSAVTSSFTVMMVGRILQAASNGVIAPQGEMRGMNAAFLALTLVGVAELLLAWLAFRKNAAGEGRTGA